MIRMFNPTHGSTGGAILLLLVSTACVSTEDNDLAEDGSAGSSGAEACDFTAGTGGSTAGSGGSESDGGIAATPIVIASAPINDATGIAINGSVTVTFSEPMNPATLTATAFTVASGTPLVPVPGTIIYADSRAVFWPQAHLASNVMYTASVTTSAKSAAGVALVEEHTWNFTTGGIQLGALAVNLRSAGAFVILAKSGISTVPPSVITGDIGVSPASAAYITGFALSVDTGDPFATAPQVNGNVYAADYAPPTPSHVSIAVRDMGLAFTDAASRPSDFTDIGAGDIGGMTLTPGIYRWGTGLLIPTSLTLKGDATSVWIFQIAEDLTLWNAKRVSLIGGALSKNVFWQVSGQVTLGSTSHFEGVVLSQTGITMGTGASINGRLLAQTIDIDNSTVIEPAP